MPSIEPFLGVPYHSTVCVCSGTEVDCACACGVSCMCVVVPNCYTCS